MRSLFIGTLVFVGMLFTAAPVHAQTEETEALKQQVVAIASYIERTFTPVSTAPLSAEEHRDVIAAAVDWFKAAQEESGHFRYEYLPYEDEYRRDDNIVRQTGALYVLGEVARKDTPEKYDLKDMAERAIGYFEARSQEDTHDGKTFRCITERTNGTRCVLGGTSLALTGLLGYLERYPGEKETYAELVDSYITYIMAMKKPGAGFRNVHHVGKATQSDKESSFSNGEALLALVRAYQYEPREDLKRTIDESFTYFENQPFDTALYLWAMAAVKDMYALWQNPAYVSYTKAFTDWRVERTMHFRNTDRNYCAYTEGVASAYSLLENSVPEAERERLRNEIAYWNNKTTTLQLDQNDVYRVIPRDGTLELKRLERPTRALGGFLTAENQPAQRIDFTQHCLSTYLQTLVDIDGEAL